MNKIIIAAFIVVVALLGGYLVTKQPTTGPSAAPSIEPTVTNESNTIHFTEAGYSPKSINVKKGTTVTFRNQSKQSMWPASAMHPTHAVYPTTGGCVGSTFDACKGIMPGEEWTFTFDLAGDWKYHDHLSPKNFGSIVVE